MSALKKVVHADSFYQCQTKRSIRMKIRDEGRMSVLYGVIRELGEAIQRGTVESLYDRIRAYKDEWFAYDYIKEQQISDDIACINRFVQTISAPSVICSNTSLEVETASAKVLGHVDFVTLVDGQYAAYIVKFKKADKSPNGKSVHTNTETDISAMAAKAYFEETYPGIVVNLVYLCNENDSLGNVGKFVVAKTKKSNIFTVAFDKYFDKVVGFDMDALISRLDEVLSVRVEPNCFNCDCKDLCQQNSITSVSKAKPKSEVTEVKSYSLPTYTASQKRVINKTDGPLLVCAGPGSGKTATLVGRIKHLIDMGVEPEFILAITFTKDAAGELKERCLGFCKPYEMPEILTLNALGYQILRMNPAFVGEVNLMTRRERITLINSLLEVTPPLAGFNYAQIKGGNGLLSKVDKALSSYQEGCRDFGADFIKFAETFESAIESHHYITYDEQITRAQKLFEEQPQVLEGISSRYKYIMVDEFQDVDEAQVRFISSLSSKYKNLCCVGDDDQSIYAFRGASNKYMLSFRELFPGAEVFTLRENFRSKEEILKAASKAIAGNKRIKKELVSTRKGGISPIHVKGQDVSDIEGVIDEIVKSGVSYEDIAVIASKNVTLQNMQRLVSFPSVLGREFLIDSPLFKTIYWSLRASVCPDDTEKCKVYLEGLVGDKSLIDSIISVKSDILAITYCESIANIIGLLDTAAFEALSSVIIKEHCKTCASLLDVMQYMCDFGDDTRIEPDTTGQVVFITSHESKGMEWTAVVMIDDYKEEVSEEQNRLVYVAMTRAKDLLYVLDNTNKQTIVAA